MDVRAARIVPKAVVAVFNLAIVKRFVESAGILQAIVQLIQGHVRQRRLVGHAIHPTSLPALSGARPARR